MLFSVCPFDVRAFGVLLHCSVVTYVCVVQEKAGATHCVDIATLTGAQIIALGGGIGAVMSPKDTAAARVIAAGTKTGGERWWQLPLEDEYFEMMKSKVR
jgi:leucyl aminopeptidase